MVRGAVVEKRREREGNTNEQIEAMAKVVELSMSTSCCSERVVDATS